MVVAGVPHMITGFPEKDEILSFFVAHFQLFLKWKFVFSTLIHECNFISTSHDN